MNFTEFLAKDVHDSWVKEPGIVLYLRKGFRADIAIVSMVAREPGNGSLTKFLDEWEPKLQFALDVSQDRLRQYFLRRDYKEYINGGNWMVSPFKGKWNEYRTAAQWTAEFDALSYPLLIGKRLKGGQYNAV